MVSFQFFFSYAYFHASHNPVGNFQDSKNKNKLANQLKKKSQITIIFNLTYANVLSYAI